jgi:hypothetical protein
MRAALAPQDCLYHVDPVTGELDAQAAPIAHDLRDPVMPVGR